MIGEKVALRAVEKEDAQLLFQWENDPETWQYGTVMAPFSLFQIERYVEKANNDIYAVRQMRLMIDRRDTAETIGSIDLFAFDPKNSRVAMGMLIHKTHRGKGFGEDALKLLIDYVFNTLSIHQLWCNIAEDNEPCIHLFKKFAFRLIGIKKDWVFRGTAWKNECMFQLINNEQNKTTS